MGSVQTRGGGGSLVETHPTRLRACGGSWTSNRTGMAMTGRGGSNANTPDISGQQALAACSAVPWLGQGSGGVA